MKLFFSIQLFQIFISKQQENLVYKIYGVSFHLSKDLYPFDSSDKVHTMIFGLVLPITRQHVFIILENHEEIFPRYCMRGNKYVQIYKGTIMCYLFPKGHG